MLALSAGLAGLSGCAGEQPTGPSSFTQPPTSHATHATATTTDEPPASAGWNLTDAHYLTMMIAHHRQALDLADLAEKRTADRQVRSIARAIERGQSREIIVMATWLADHGLPEPTVDELAAMDTMAGMLSPDRMRALKAARGGAFDRRFLKGMIKHHRGAITMADDVLGSGEDIRVSEMATDVIATQNGEIRRLKDLLER